MTRRTAYGTGRLVDECRHHTGWTQNSAGEARCDRCGTRRFPDYGSLRPPGLPQVITPSPEAARAADREAARRVAEAVRRGGPGRRTAAAAAT
ncbi:DUF6255 family natural product biosynthesis protein [Streptomyces sp. NPDC046261]|uniref:DUF6255 family natural product biosynthesis protein n=1 Tax=Streptomyces sp. NPDC046261 TaxID=3157200 RepID=UPI0033DA7E09